jgi:hypothetical protein
VQNRSGGERIAAEAAIPQSSGLHSDSAFYNSLPDSRNLPSRFALSKIVPILRLRRVESPS